MIKLMFVGLCAGSLSLYLIIVLCSFNYADPGWMQSSWNESICNKGGLIGSKIADFLFFVFGGVAYLFPLLIIFYFWKFFFTTVNVTGIVVILELLKILIFLIACCILAQYIMDGMFYFPSGGIIGNVLFSIININQHVEWDLILLFVGILSSIYFFNHFFLDVIKKIIKYIIYIICISLITFLKIIDYRHRHIQQAYFNAKICPSVFLIQKKSIYRQNYSNTYITNKALHTYTKYTNDSSSMYRSYVPNHSVVSKSTSLSCNIFNQYRHVVGKCQNYIKFDFYRKKYNFHYIKLINKNYSQYNKNTKILSKNIKIIRNNFQTIPLILKKKLHGNNIMLVKDVGLICDNENILLSNPIKSGFLNINKNTVVSSVRDFNSEFTDNIQIGNISSLLPDVNLLISNPQKNIVDYSELKKISQLVEQKLLEYRIVANVTKIITGPVITCFALNLSAGIKSSKVSGISRDLARSLSVNTVRVVEIIPGTSYVGLEIPNKKRHTVYLKDIIHSNKFQDIKSPLAVGLGKDIFGEPVIEDLRYMPHLLVAGTTGSGKSIGINAMIISILYKATPEDVRFIMIDPKILELSIYSDIPHLLKEVITDTQNAESILQWCVEEMECRYKLMSVLGVRNLENYNNQIEQFITTKQHINNKNKYLFSTYKKLPYIIIIIDELSDLMIMSDKKVEILITRLTQKARAAGIHLILSTQRPSVDVITGLIKANIPARIAFTVSSKIDSRTILGQSGAESLLGRGDMLYLPANSSMLVRIHGAYVQDQEIQEVVKYWKTQKK